MPSAAKEDAHGKEGPGLQNEIAIADAVNPSHGVSLTSNAGKLTPLTLPANGSDACCVVR